MSITQSDYIGAKRPGRRGGEAAAPRAAGATGRRPAWVWAAPFCVTLGVLLARNAFLFSTPEYERADMGANSILIEQARRLRLLVGNYSRKGFNHPGPAFLYVQSWGESVFWAMLRLVPTAWNGQLIAVYALNALFAACVVAVSYGWTRTARGALAAGAAVACLGALHPPAFSSDWMPYVYVPPFLAFVVSLASTAAGRSQDAWIAALSGWFLVHGHAAFLVIVPAMALAAAVPGGWRAVRAAAASPSGARASLAAAALRGVLGRPRTWLPAAVISAAFALPLVLELALHGDGNFARYFAYGSSSSAGGHSAAQVAGFVLWFWWPAAGAWAVPAGVAAVVALALAAGLLTWRLPAGQARTFCRSLLAVDALAAAMVIVYAVTGVDQIGDHYIGYFSWAAPAVLLMVILVAAAEGPGFGRAGLAVAAAAALAACAAFAAAPATRTSTADVDPLNPRAGYPTDQALPAAVARMGALAAGRPVVLTFPHDNWTDVTGILVQAGRTGVDACVRERSWAFLMSVQSVCTPAQARNGYPMSVYPDGQIPAGEHVVAKLQRALVTSGIK
ncbi:MAG TPA: hypothetical protein VGM12_15600 [Trebonia sp.]